MGVYETMFFLEVGAYNHPETWGSEVVICRGCYDDIRAEMPELFAKAKRVKARLEPAPRAGEEAPCVGRCPPESHPQRSDGLDRHRLGNPSFGKMEVI